MFYGHMINDSDTMPKAKEAVVFLIAALNLHWKIPEFLKFRFPEIWSWLFF